MGAVLNEPPPCLESVPLSTYRLQFNAGFRFKDARAILDYLQALGIGAIYASPYLRARSGSPHGYDIVAHDEINPDIGTAREHARLIRDAQCRGIAHILDVVPHHMAIDVDNRWWYDVLEWGEASPYATFFDIDWHAPHGDLEGKVLMPFLGEPCEDAIVRGALAAHFDEPSGALSVTHGTERYPLAPNSYAFALREAAREAEATLAHDLNALAGDFEAVESHPQARARFEHLRSRLSAIAASESARGAVTKALRRSLAVVLAQQHYHLAPWRTANATVNYRRFFDINNLVALRVEDASVFARTHAMTLEMLADGRAQGVRIDHIDGLLDPADYCRRLREHASEHGYAPYLIVEKILTGDEQLPTIWGVHGTTGYDFMNAVNALFVNARARLRFDRIYRDFAGADEPYEQIVYRAKHDVLRTQLRASLDRVARSFLQLSPCSGYALDTIREALAETIASVPVYRTYATASACSSEDRRTIAAAIALARERSTNADDSIFTAIEEILTISHESFAHAAMTFAQLTPAVAAKGIEDTAFYRFVRLLSLNEVGGDPRRFGSTIDAFHRFNERRAAEHPLGMLATATHDQKRGEDARMRINALSEMPARWRRALRSLRLLDATPASGSVAESPSANDRYALLQTLLATWPAEWTAIPEAESLDAYLRRIERWLIKAVREAKLRTSWIDPDPAYESASIAYLRGLFEPERVGAFAALFLPLACDVASIGMVSSLAQTVLKLTSIGVPDVYQGCELWDLSLVDPDNRNPVDFTVRMRALDEMCNALERGTQQELVGSLLREWRDGRIKLYVLRQLLQMRRQRPDIVHRTYRRLGCGGEPRGRLVAFARGDLLVVLPRLVAPLVHLRADAPHLDIAGAYVNLPRDLPRRYRNVLTGEFVTAREASHGRRITASDLFRTLPVAVLEGCES